VRTLRPKPVFARWCAAAALIALSLSACGDSSDVASSSTPEPGLAHIHGLGINPADRQLYVASHHGVFRLSDGRVERMGKLIQDTMGFTIAGPDRFLGSGHPDIRNDTILKKGDRPLLGLIESTDRATSWKGRSLQGEVDFHALAYAHGQVYGFDATSGRFMVSADSTTWDTRSQISMSSFAVSPDDADTIISAAETRLMRSTDGGRSWQPAPPAPNLAFLSWSKSAGLWALGIDSSVHRSTDGGSTWTSAGRVSGRPAAILADDTGIVVATTTAVSRSTNQGDTWTKLTDVA